MLKEYAKLEDAHSVIRFLSPRIKKHADKLAIAHKRPNGKEVWTKGIWTSFEELRKKLGRTTWKLHPKNLAKGSGRADSEFLIDFFLYDDRFGPRIACESELSPKDDKVEWAFDKLISVKSDIKILIFEKAFESKLPKLIEDIVKKYLTNFSHIYEGEIYILMQLDGNGKKSFGTENRSFIWQAPRRGPFKGDEITFQEVH